MTEPNSIAVIHNAYLTYGGAERVADELARTFDAPVYAGYIDSETTPDDEISRRSVFGALAQRGAQRSGVFRELHSFYGWQHCPPLTDYDVLVQTAPAVGTYVPEQNQTVIRYIHDMPRTVYDRFQEEAGSMVAQLFGHVYRVQYRSYVDFADQYIANSEYIQERLEKYWRVDDATVVYPPVDIEQFGPSTGKELYLSYGRLAERKHIHDVVEAFESLPDERLVVGGVGDMADIIQARSKELPNVDYEGYLSESRKRELLADATAVIHPPTDESFGIVPVEAFASGTPVIAANAGYSRYLVEDERTGVLFEPPADPDTIATAIRRFRRTDLNADSNEFSDIAEQFDVSVFREQMKQVVDL